MVLEKLNALQRKIASLDALHMLQSESSDGGHDSDDMEVTDPLHRIRRDLYCQREALMMRPSPYFSRFPALRVRARALLSMAAPTAACVVAGTL